MLYQLEFQTTQPIFNDEYKDYVRTTIDGFIKDPGNNENLIRFGDLFNLMKFSFDTDYCKLENIKTNNFKTIEEDLNKYYAASVYGKFISEYLSTPPLTEVNYTFDNESTTIFPMPTKLAQIVHTPLLFEHLISLEEQLSSGNYYAKSGVNLGFFYLVLKNSCITPDKELGNFIDHEYPLFEYSLQQNIFLSGFANEEVLYEAFSNLKHNQKEMFTNYLRKSILFGEDNGNKQDMRTLNEIDVFLKELPLKIKNIKQYNGIEQEEIASIVQILVDFRKQIEPLCTTQNIEMYHALWAFEFKPESIEYRRELFKQYLGAYPDCDLSLETMLINFMSEQYQPAFELPPKEIEKLANISLRRKVKNLQEILSFGALLHTCVYHTKINQTKYEKQLLSKGLEMLPQPPNSMSKSTPKLKQKI